MNQFVLPQYFIVLWIPYFLILFHFYNKQNILAIIILMCAGLLNYRLPLIAGMDARVFDVGLLFCFSVDLVKMSILGGRHENCDRIIRAGIILYYLLFLVSVIVATFDTLPNKIYAAIDTSLLFFLTIKCIRSKKDVNNLLKGIIFSVSLVAVLGIVGFLVDDPWFGTMSGDKEELVAIRMDKSQSFGKKFSNYTMAQSGRAWFRVAIVSTTESPNALGVVLVFNLYILLYLWFRSKKNIYKMLIFGLILLSSITLIMTAALTAIIAGAFGLFIFIILSLRLREFYFNPRKYILIVLLLITTFFVLAQNRNISETVTNKFSEVKSVYDFVNANDRIVRWNNSISKMTPQMLVIGIGKQGAEGTQGTHNNYLTIIYIGGIWALLAFGILLLRSIRNSLNTYDKLLGHCLFIALIMYTITGMTYQHAFSLSRGVIFWPIIAILASPIAVDRLQHKNALGAAVN